MTRSPGFPAVAECLALVLLTSCFSCQQEIAIPPDAAVRVAGTWITRGEIDAIAAFLLEGHPVAGMDTARAAALEAALIPRAIAQKEFATGVKSAREKAKLAMTMIRAREFFEDTRKELTEFPDIPIPLTIHRKLIEPALGAAIFGKAAGTLTASPVETWFSIVIARVDMPVPEAGPLQESVMYSPIEFFYDVTLTDVNFRRNWIYQRMQQADYAVVDSEVLNWMPPFLRPRTEVLPARKDL